MQRNVSPLATLLRSGYPAKITIKSTPCHAKGDEKESRKFKKNIEESWHMWKDKTEETIALQKTFLDIFTKDNLYVLHGFWDNVDRRVKTNAMFGQKSDCTPTPKLHPRWQLFRETEFYWRFSE